MRWPSRRPSAALTPEPGRDLIDRCRQGDRKAMSAVLGPLVPELRRLLVTLEGPAIDIDDLLQQVLTEAVHAFPRYRGEASLRTWLTRIAVHLVQHELRRPGRRRVAFELVREADEPQDAPSPERLAEDRRRLERVYELFFRLEPRLRVALVLHVFEGRSMDEVAALTGSSSVLARARVFRARRKLLEWSRTDPLLAERGSRGGPR